MFSRNRSRKTHGPGSKQRKKPLDTAAAGTSSQRTPTEKLPEKPPLTGEERKEQMHATLMHFFDDFDLTLDAVEEFACHIETLSEQQLRHLTIYLFRQLLDARKQSEHETEVRSSDDEHSFSRRLRLSDDEIASSSIGVFYPGSYHLANPLAPGYHDPHSEAVNCRLAPSPHHNTYTVTRPNGPPREVSAHP